MTAPLGPAEPVAFLPSTDLDRSRAFYCGVLGLAPVDQTPFAVVLRAGPIVLRVTLVQDLRPAPYTVLGWQVDDLSGTLAGLGARGVEPVRYPGMEQDEHGAWRTPGGERVAWFHDPDGNVLSLTGPAADR